MPDVALTRTQVRQTRDDFTALNERTGVGSGVVDLCDSHEAFRDVAQRFADGWTLAPDGWPNIPNDWQRGDDRERITSAQLQALSVLLRDAHG